MTKAAQPDKDVAAVEKILGHVFRDPALVAEALTHPSIEGETNYQRLEFLGDRIIGLAIAERVYEDFPDEPEGKLNRRLAALVRRETLAEVARALKLARHIRMTDTVARGKGRENSSILADVFEALVGALYVDAGFTGARAFVGRALKPFIARESALKDPKSALQEWAQGRGLPLPGYKSLSQSGPDHAPAFVVEVSVEGHGAARAEGTSKKEAETKAAAALYAKLKSAK